VQGVLAVLEEADRPTIKAKPFAAH